MSQPVRARRLSQDEGRYLLRLVCWGKYASTRVRRALVIMASAWRWVTYVDGFAGPGRWAVRNTRRYSRHGQHSMTAVQIAVGVGEPQARNCSSVLSTDWIATTRIATGLSPLPTDHPLLTTTTEIQARRHGCQQARIAHAGRCRAIVTTCGPVSPRCSLWTPDTHAVRAQQPDTAIV